MKKNKPNKTNLKRLHDRGQKSKGFRDRKLSNPRCGCGYHIILPWWCPYVVTLVTLVVRVSYVIDRRSWWILHPDEVYQTVEVGFSLMSGYGLRSYEYLPAPTNTNVSMETQILNSGMYALRSFVLPHIFAAAIWTAKFLGCTWSSFLIGRVFNIIVTSILPLAVFNFVYVVFRCRFIALLSCALTATSLHLAVLGTHPLVNSFTAPFILFGMTMCLGFYSETCIGNSTEQRAPDIQSGVSDINANVLENSIESDNNIHKNSQTYKNGNGLVLKGERKLPSDEGFRRLEHGQPEIIQTSAKSTVSELQPTSNIMTNLWPYFGGVLIGLTTYVRPDTAIFISSVFVPLALSLMASIPCKGKAAVLSIVGVFSSGLVCIIDDFNRYGSFVFSPVQWYNFNVMSPKAGIIFGSGSMTSYLDVFYMDKLNFMLSVCAIVIVFIVPFIKNLKPVNTKSTYALVASFFLMLLIYTIVGHKEVKIIQNLFIIQAIISATALHFIAIYARSLQLKQIYVTISVLSFLSVCAISCYQSFPSAESTASNWSYKDPKVSRDVFSCLDFVRNQNYVNGVMINASVYNFGGYSSLEHDVPILVMVHQEYHLYQSKNQNRLGESNRIRVFTDFSDFIDIDNKPYVFEVIRDANLNYVISQNSNRKQFDFFGYETIFQHGDYSVFKEKDMGSNVPIEDFLSFTVDDPDIIEYESNWLITNGLYTKAISRINRALEINQKLRQKPRVRLYQLLFVCYGRMNEVQKIKFYQDECFSIYGRTKCVTPQEKLIRHHEYSHLN